MIILVVYLQHCGHVKRVATLHQGLLPAGDHGFRWNGMHSDGTRAREGVYFCRVLGAGASTTRRLILIGAP